jgi:anti-anti-sigma factor
MISAPSRPQVDTGAVVRVAGELDMSNVDAFDAALERAASRADAIVCVDLAAVTFIDSAALHALARLAERLPDGCVILHRPSDAARRLFALVGLERWQNVHIV